MSTDAPRGTDYFKAPLTCSVLIPVYNGRSFIEGAIASALTDGDWVSEVVVVDNCSTDGTREYLKNLDAPKVKTFFNDTNVGLFGNFNRCLDHAAGDIVVFLCADDRLCAGAVQQAVRFYTQHPGVSMLNMTGEAVDESGQVIKMLGATIAPGIYRDPSLVDACITYLATTGKNPFNYPTGVFFNRRLIDTIRFDPSFRKCGDLDFYFKVMTKGDFAATDQKACRILFHAGQEGQQDRSSTLELQEYLRILNNPRLSFSPTIRDTLRQSFGALALWRGMMHLAKGHFHGFRTHVRQAFADGSHVKVIALFLLFAWRRMTGILWRQSSTLRPMPQGQSLTHQRGSR